MRPQPVPLHPAGPEVCTCLQPRSVYGHWDLSIPGTEHGTFVCEQQMDGEDGLCRSCRNSHMCKSWRIQLAALTTTPEEIHA